MHTKKELIGTVKVPPINLLNVNSVAHLLVTYGWCFHTNVPKDS